MLLLDYIIQPDSVFLDSSMWSNMNLNLIHSKSISNKHTDFQRYEEPHS
jgi:hypothetical protein